MGRETDTERPRHRVGAALGSDELIDESQVDVQVADGVVTLVGSVGSYAEKLIAQHVTQGVDDVHDPVNAIDVKPASDMRPSDDELLAILEQVLAWDALVPEQHIEVSVADGLVAPTGRCPTRVKAREAERAVSHLWGVRAVLNRIEVASTAPSRKDVRTVIVEALGRRAAHSTSRLDVVVAGSTVTLRGAVQSPAERDAVVGAVGHASGISDIREELSIEADRPRSPER